jgi:hypothetical protein
MLVEADWRGLAVKKFRATATIFPQLFYKRGRGWTKKGLASQSYRASKLFPCTGKTAMRLSLFPPYKPRTRRNISARDHAKFPKESSQLPYFFR